MLQTDHMKSTIHISFYFFSFFFFHPNTRIHTFQSFLQIQDDKYCNHLFLAPRRSTSFFLYFFFFHTIHPIINLQYKTSNITVQQHQLYSSHIFNTIQQHQTKYIQQTKDYVQMTFILYRL